MVERVGFSRTIASPSSPSLALASLWHEPRKKKGGTQVVFQRRTPAAQIAIFRAQTPAPRLLQQTREGSYTQGHAGARTPRLYPLERTIRPALAAPTTRTYTHGSRRARNRSRRSLLHVCQRPAPTATQQVHTRMHTCAPHTHAHPPRTGAQHDHRARTHALIPTMVYSNRAVVQKSIPSQIESCFWR